VIVAGFGFRGAAGQESLAQALRQAQADARVQASALATLTDKALHPGFDEFAGALGLPVLSVTEGAASDIDTPTQSPYVQDARGAGSVAEATALAAAGPGAVLLCARVISEDRLASCAIARGAGAAKREHRP